MKRVAGLMLSMLGLGVVGYGANLYYETYYVVPKRYNYVYIYPEFNYLVIGIIVVGVLAMLVGFWIALGRRASAPTE